MSNSNEQSLEQTMKCPKCKEDVQLGAKKCKHCGADLRNWFVRHKIVTGILILFVIGIVGSSMSGENNKQTNGNSATSTDGSSAKTTEKEVPSKPKEWQKVIGFTASANKQSETFHLEGGQQKIIYKTTGGQMSLCVVYVMDEGTSLDENGGFPVVTIDGSKSDETMMRKNAGDYYLDFKVANGSCTVELQEYK